MSSKTELQSIRKDRTFLSTSDITNHQNQLIKEWKPKSEVFSLRFGPYILGAAASVSGVIINSYFRRKLQLRNLGFNLSNLTMMAGPFMLANTLHTFKITQKVIVFEQNCPMCLDTRAALFQNAAATFYPMILAPAINLGIAAGGGLRVPNWNEGREILGIVRATLVPKIPALTIMFTINAVIAIAVTQHEIFSMDRIQQIMANIEKKMHSKYVEHFQ